MADGPSIGTAYLRVAGDFSDVQAQAVGLFSSERWKKQGKVAGAALAGGLAAAGVVKGLYEIGQAFDDVEDTIRVRTGASGKNLKRLNADFKSVIKDVPVDFATAGEAVAGLAQRLDLTGKPLREMSKQMAALSKITDTDVKGNVEAVSKAFVDWEVATKDQSKTLDGLFRLSQKSGLAVDEIASAVQRFGSPLRQLGFSLEESAAMFANFERAGVNTQTMVPGLKLAISNLTRPTEDLGASMSKLGISVGKPERALREVFALMSDKGLSTVEKTGLAMDVFGKRAGADMAEAIRQGRFEVSDLMKVMEKGGKTIRQTERRTRDFDESIQLLKNRVAVALEPTARRVFDEIGSIAKEMGDVVASKNLSLDEKINRIADIIGREVEQNLPKIAEAGGRIGLRLAGALVRAFWDSPLLGKIFLGAVFLKAIGGKGGIGKVFENLGMTAGKRFAVGAIAGLILFGPAIAEEANKWGERIEEALIPEGPLKDLFDFGDPGEIGGFDFSSTTKKAKKDLSELVSVTRRHFDEVADSARKNSRGVEEKWGGSLASVRKRGDRDTDRFAREAGGNFRSLANASAGALAHLSRETKETLAKLKVKTGSDLYVAKPMKGGGGDTVKAQRGGPINRGAPTGDSVPAMLERGEYVLNREAVKRVGVRMLDRLNFDNAPRFQVGGVAGLKPGISRLASWAADRYGLRVSSGLRPGDPGHHGTGEAVDLIPPGMTPTKGIFGAFKNQLQELFYDPWGGFDSGQQIGAIGGHLDHIHAAILGAGTGGPGAVERLAKVLLQGPKGPLRSTGQAHIDLGYEAMASLLRRRAGTSHGDIGIGDVSGPLQQIAQRMIAETWGQGQWPPFNELVQRESGWDPSAVNPSSGAAGLAQALPPSKYPPGAWPYQGKQSAVLQLQWMVDYIQERYGNPSGAIAWHDSHNWYREGGLVGNIRELYGDLQGLGKGKKADKRAGSLNDKIRKLTQRLNRKRRRSEKNRLHGIKNPGIANAVSASLANWVNTFTDKANVTEDAISRLEIKHGGTLPPDSLEDAMSMLGMTLGANQEWEGLDPTTQKRISNLLGSEFGREKMEIDLEIGKNEELLSYLVSQRNSVLAALKDADRQLRDVAKEIRKAQEEREKAARQARQIDKEAERLEKRAKNAKGAQRRQLEARAAEKRFAARQKRADAAFQTRKIEALTGRREAITTARDDYQSSLDEVQGSGSPMGDYITALPPLTDGGTPLFGGRLLAVQDHLRTLGSTKVVTPDFSSGDASSATDDSERKQLELDRALDTIRNLNVELFQRPDFENFLANAPRFDTGGVMPGPYGVHSPAMVAGGERVLTMEEREALALSGGRSQPHIENHFNIDWVGMEAMIETRVDGVIAKRQSIARRDGSKVLVR